MRISLRMLLQWLLVVGALSVWAADPTSQPSGQPSPRPTTAAPSAVPSRDPTPVPTVAPTPVPTVSPTSSRPSGQPSAVPTAGPTSSHPSGAPSTVPTQTPTGMPTTGPSGVPTTAPQWPSSSPSGRPSGSPSGEPTAGPTRRPSAAPSGVPSLEPTQPTAQPSPMPSSVPSGVPTHPTSVPSGAPTMWPSGAPTAGPSPLPSSEPTQPTGRPSRAPSAQPHGHPSAVPSRRPSAAPSGSPTSMPTTPTGKPSAGPTGSPTTAPTPYPTGLPTCSPTPSPSGEPTGEPTGSPTALPTTADSVRVLRCGECQGGRGDNECAFFSANISVQCPFGSDICEYNSSLFHVQQGVHMIFESGCSLYVDSHEFIMENDTYLSADSVSVDVIGVASVRGTVSTSGRGPTTGPGAQGIWFRPGYGGSYGGSGGAFDDANVELSVTSDGSPYVLSPYQIGYTRPDYDFPLIGTPLDPTMGSGGGDMVGAGAGGGRIILRATRTALWSTAVLAADGSASHNPLAGGGSGGSISIFTDTLQGFGTVRANGGAGVSLTGTGCGSGGRILIEVSNATTVEVTAIATGGSSAANTRTNGAPGTVFYSVSESVDFTLEANIIVDNRNTITAATVLFNDTILYPQLMGVQIRGKAILLGNELSLSLSATCKAKSFTSDYDTTLCSSLAIDDAEVVGSVKFASGPVPGAVDTIAIQADVIHILNGSFVRDATVVTLNSVLLYLDSTSIIEYSQRASAHSRQDSRLWGSVYQSGPTVNSCWNGTVISETFCDSVDTATGSWIGSNPYAGLLAIRADTNMSIGAAAVLSAPAVILCADHATYAAGSTVESASQGCSPNHGYGAGGVCADMQAPCGGGGGGFYGAGGSGVDAPGGIFYGRYNSSAGSKQILYMGSGGGCAQCTGLTTVYQGFGGGLVMLVGIGSIKMNGIVTSSGEDVTGGSSDGSGAGSGGSVLVYTPTLTGTGTFYSTGGAGGVSGGGGSGGQIFLDRLIEYKSGAVIPTSGQFEGTFYISGGAAGSGSGTAPGADGSIIPPNCNPGYGNIYYSSTHQLHTCVVCDKGMYKAGSGNGGCEPCDDIPDHSYYVVTGEDNPSCEFLCDDGLTYAFDECLTFFEIFVEGLGGQAVFSAISVSALLLIFAPVLVYRNLKKYGYFKKKYRHKKKVEENTGSKSFDWFTGNTAIADAGLFLTTDDDEKLMPGADKERMSSVSMNDGGVSPLVMLSPLHDRASKHLEEDEIDDFRTLRIAKSMSDKDRPKHVGRVYFSGSNSPWLLGAGGSWVWPQVCPRHLLPMIQEREYAELVNAVNHSVRWVSLSFESICLALLYVFIPAHAPHFLRSRRKVRAQTLLNFLERYNYSCFRSSKQRRKKNCLRVSISMDMTLAYVDFLCDEAVVEKPFRPLITPGQPKLPLAIRLAGTGSYFCPWHIDTNDVLIQAIPQCPIIDTFIDSHWISCIAELNNILRTVSRYAVKAGFTKFIKRLGDTWTMKPLGGLIIEFCVFWNYKPTAVAASPRRSTRPSKSRTDIEAGGQLDSSTVPGATDDNSYSPPAGFDNSQISGDMSTTKGADVHGTGPAAALEALEQGADIDQSSYSRMDYFKTSKDFGKMCELLFTGELLPGIVIYQPAMLNSKGKWDKRIAPMPEENIISPTNIMLQQHGTVVSVSPGNPEFLIDPASVTPSHAAMQTPPRDVTGHPDSAQVHYGSKAADMEKFYNIVRATDGKVGESLSPEVSQDINFERGVKSAAVGDVPTEGMPVEHTSAVGEEDPWRRSNCGSGSDAGVGADDNSQDKKHLPDSGATPDSIVDSDVEYSSFPAPKAAPTSKRKTFLSSHLSGRKPAAGQADSAAPGVFGVDEHEKKQPRVLQTLSSFGEFVKGRLRTDSRDGGSFDMDTSEGRSVADIAGVALQEKKIDNNPEFFDINSPAMWRWDKVKGEIRNVYEICAANYAARGDKNDSTGSSAFRVTISTEDEEMFRYSDEADDHADAKSWQYVLDYWQQAFHFMTSLLTVVFFGRNMYPHGKRLRYLRKILEFLLSLCCVYDFICLSFFTVLYYCIWGNSSECDDHSGFYIIVSVWPGALLVAPLAGFTAIGLGKGGTFPRIYSVWSRLATISLINLIWIYFYKQDNAPYYVVYLLTGMIISRFFQSSTIDVYISYIEGRRKTRGWDGLSTSLAVVQDNGDFELEAD